MEITGKIVGTRREQDTGSSHTVYTLDGFQDVHTEHGVTIYVDERIPSVEDQVVIDAFVAPDKRTYAGRIQIVSS